MNMSVAALVLKQEPYSHVINDRVSCQWTIHFTYFASSICSCHVCFNYNINSHFPFTVEFVCLLKQLIVIYPSSDGNGLCIRGVDVFPLLYDKST